MNTNVKILYFKLQIYFSCFSIYFSVITFIKYLIPNHKIWELFFYTLSCCSKYENICLLQLMLNVIIANFIVVIEIFIYFAIVLENMKRLCENKICYFFSNSVLLVIFYLFEKPLINFYFCNYFFISLINPLLYLITHFYHHPHLFSFFKKM